MAFMGLSVYGVNATNSTNQEYFFMKKCPFCAEEIQDEAVKCRFCNEFLEKQKPKVSWYFSTSTLTIGMLCVGPLVLPLVWLHPTMSLIKKVFISAVLIILTIVILQVLSNVQQAFENFSQMGF